MKRDQLADLSALLAVAQEGSFTRAAVRLGLSQSALSHAIRRLETRVGVRLLTRTTRRVAPTEAGEQLLDTVRPAFDGIEARLASLGELRERPAGTIRITTSEHAAHTILWPALRTVLPAYPDITLELSVDSGFRDIVEDRFDAGVRLGEAIAQDMVVVRIGPDLRMAVVGAPSYLEGAGIPLAPQDLARHRCVNLRQQSSGGLYSWDLEKGGRAVRVRVEGQFVFNSAALLLHAACDGFGLAYVMEDLAMPLIRDGTLVRVLEDWCQPFSGYHLYYPSRRQSSAAFNVVMDALRYRGQASSP